MEKQKKKYVAMTFIIGLIFIAFTLLVEFFLTEVCQNFTFKGAKFLIFLLGVFKIIGEAGVVACVIGLLIELAHFRRFYDTLIRQALVDEEYLRKFKAPTLDDIIMKSYRIKNENEITNDLHLWQNQFDFAWSNIKDLPIRPYRTNYKHIFNFFYYPQNQLKQYIETDLFKKFKFDLSNLNTDILIIEEIKEFSIISPELNKRYKYSLNLGDLITPFKEIPENTNPYNLLIYELLKDGEEVKLKQDNDYLYEIGDDGYIKYSLNYNTDVGPKTHFNINVYSVEPQIDNFYCHFFTEVADAVTVYFYFNVDLEKLDFEYWFQNEIKEKFELIDKTNRGFTFSYNTWIFPGSGYAVMWDK